MARYIVRAAQIVVEVSDARREVYLLRGTRLPETATEASVARLLDRGLIAPKGQTTDAPDTPDAPDVPEQPVEPSKPVGDMTDLTVAELRKLADERGVTVPKSASKAVLIEELKHAQRFPEPDVSSLDVAGLLAQAAARGIDVPDGVSDRDDLIALLNQ